MADGPTITVLPDGAVVRAAPGETVLAALARSGYAHRTGCRRGGCGICKMDFLDGEMRYALPVAETVLSSKERAARVCLSCRAIPLTDVVVHLRDGDRLRSLWSPRLRLRLQRRAEGSDRLRRAPRRARRGPTPGR
jgi:ferredoxin